MKVDELFEVAASMPPPAPRNLRKLGNLIGYMVAGKTVNPNKSWSGDFNCVECGLTSLEGAPISTGGYFDCGSNLLTSLEHAPKKIGAAFRCSHNKLTSLHNIHKQIESIDGMFHADHNPIKSHVLGLLKIKKLDWVNMDNIKVMDIINKYLPEGDIVACQQELIEAGLDEYAQL